MFSPGSIHQLVDISGVFFGNKYLKKYLNWQKVSISYLVFSLESPQFLTLKSRLLCYFQKQDFFSCLLVEGVFIILTNRAATWLSQLENGIGPSATR